ncbi:MAG: hypothetical protein ACO1OB_10210 [Archangium sp.]
MRISPSEQRKLPQRRVIDSNRVTPERLRLSARDSFSATRLSASTQAGLDTINAADLKSGKKHRCVETVRKNLINAGMGAGVPSTTDKDPNNPRGMMVQMLQSGKWKSAEIPGAETKVIDSPYGKVKAQVLSGEAYEEAVKKGLIPEGAVVFQTKHGWDYGEGSSGNDVGIVRNGKIFNYEQMPDMTVYKNVKEVVVLLPA